MMIQQPLSSSKYILSFARISKLLTKPQAIRHHLHTTPPSHNLFGGGPTSSKSLKGKLSANPEQLLKPSAKTQVSSNPADILTQNDILMYSTKPQNYIESIKHNGFHLSNNYFIQSPDSNGDLIGLCLLGSETFEVKLTNNKSKKGENKEVNCTIDNHIVTFMPSILQIFAKIHPKPELVVVGLGKTSRLLNKDNRTWFSECGIQLEISDSTNAGQIYDLLSTERPGVIGALLLPPNL
ncbi:hypothetical protein CANMA_001480 [Candida margitis]|uniref:uncharacterized protein n=1 Tax=Candida margitis TaxID=1775924 RepID=UPI002227FE8C|nr:uncharacterized protein CANMA_001480 [Candida margitis]KAI5969413.1 hypothetical protein CANMA_001480 [Candida margitis]